MGFDVIYPHKVARHCETEGKFNFPPPLKKALMCRALYDYKLRFLRIFFFDGQF